MERFELVGSYNYSLLIKDGWIAKGIETVNGKKVASMVRGGKKK